MYVFKVQKYIYGGGPGKSRGFTWISSWAIFLCKDCPGMTASEPIRILLVGERAPWKGNQGFPLWNKKGVRPIQRAIDVLGQTPFLFLPRHWSTLPASCPASTIDAGGLNFRIRNGNGCGPSARSTGNEFFEEKFMLRQR